MRHDRLLRGSRVEEEEPLSRRLERLSELIRRISEPTMGEDAQLELQRLAAGEAIKGHGALSEAARALLVALIAEIAQDLDRPFPSVFLARPNEDLTDA